MSTIDIVGVLDKHSSKSDAKVTVVPLVNVLSCIGNRSKVIIIEVGRP